MCGKTFCSCKMVYALPSRDCLLSLAALDGPDEQYEKGAKGERQ